MRLLLPLGSFVTSFPTSGSYSAYYIALLLPLGSFTAVLTCSAITDARFGAPSTPFREFLNLNISLQLLELSNLLLPLGSFG